MWTDQPKKQARDALKVFAIVLLIGCVVNGISYFLRSDGYGLQRVADGLVRWGVPFLVLDKGGVDGRDRFYWKALAANALCAVGLAIFVTVLWYLMAKAAHG
jgi:hypothetical protein